MVGRGSEDQRSRDGRSEATGRSAAALAVVWLVLGVNERIPAIPLEFGIDWAAATFTFGIALAVGVLFGVSLHATRMAVASALRDSAATANIAFYHGLLARPSRVCVRSSSVNST